MIANQNTNLSTTVIILIVVGIVVGCLIGLLVGMFFIRSAPLSNPLAAIDPEGNDAISSIPTITLPTNDELPEITPTSTEANNTDTPPLSEPSSTDIPAVEPTSIPQQASTCQRPERVLLIVMDGMRSDSIWDGEHAPFLLGLAQNSAAYTWQAKTVKPSKTIPAHTSLFTGNDVPTHGVLDNLPYKDQAIDEGIVLEQATIFTRLKDSHPEAVTLFVGGNKALLYFLQPVLDDDKVYTRADNFQVAAEAQRLMIENGFDLMFVNLGYQDIIGHEAGWNSGPYFQAVAQADQAVQSILETLRKLEIFDSTMVIITADHGGKEFTHSLNRPEDEIVPLILLGPCIKQGHQLSSETDQIRIFDLAPTILYALGLEIPADLDGRVIEEAFLEEFR